MKTIFLLLATFSLGLFAHSQDAGPKEKAEALAKNEFSKSKHAKVDKNGVVKQKKKEIISTPVVESELSFYHGNYVYDDLGYKLEIRSDAQNNTMATLSIKDGAPLQLKNVAIKDAYFTATKINEDGTQEFWQGAFINKSNDGISEFGLGIKLSKPIQITDGLQMTKIFFKKVSP